MARAWRWFVATGLLLLGVLGALGAPTPARADPMPAPPAPRGPVWIRSQDGVEVLVYPPREASTPRPIFVMLHGMCDEPENECPHFAESVSRRGWLVCPRAPVRCPGGGSIWQYSRRFDTVEESVAAVHAAFPGKLDEAPGRTLIGFSLGGIFGMDIAHHPESRIRYAVLMGAKVYPNARWLEAAGVEKLALIAGDRDMMAWHMREQARRVERQGVDARFVSLGNVGHWFPRDLTPRLDAILEWLETPSAPRPDGA